MTLLIYMVFLIVIVGGMFYLGYKLDANGWERHVLAKRHRISEIPDWVSNSNPNPQLDVEALAKQGWGVEISLPPAVRDSMQAIITENLRGVTSKIQALAVCDQLSAQFTEMFQANHVYTPGPIVITVNDDITSVDVYFGPSK